MRSTASIKCLKLPGVPRPATRPISAKIPGEHELAIPTHAEIHNCSDAEAYKASAARARARRMGNAERRHDVIKSMAMEGCSDEEIAEATGYKPDSVRRLVSKMRREGEDIPERKKGRKRCRK